MLIRVPKQQYIIEELTSIVNHFDFMLQEGLIIDKEDKKQAVQLAKQLNNIVNELWTKPL